MRTIREVAVLIREAMEIVQTHIGEDEHCNHDLGAALIKLRAALRKLQHVDQEQRQMLSLPVVEKTAQKG